MLIFRDTDIVKIQALHGMFWKRAKSSPQVTINSLKVSNTVGVQKDTHTRFPLDRDVKHSFMEEMHMD